MTRIPVPFSTAVTGAAALAAALFVAGSIMPNVASAQGYASTERGSVALSNALNSLGNTSRVLVIGAHPDDEDTQLIAWLARGRHVEAAYLSLTRGDGGQNLIGNELGEALGVIRTQELLAARRIDGGRQFFTRAFDFGFSKNAEETLQHWPKDTIMGDVVRVVRAFRPQVIVAVFSGTPRDGHGHHQVSGILARDAYDASGDTIRFPVAAYGSPWTVSKFYRRVRVSDESPTTKMNIGEYDPLVGRSYSEIASDSRSQHKSQGFGVLQQKGVFIDQIGLEASRVTDVKNALSEKSIFDGVDTTWARLRAFATRRDVQSALDSANILFARARALDRPDNPTPTVEPLAAAVRLLRVARDSSGERPSRLLAGENPLATTRFLDFHGMDVAQRSALQKRDAKYVSPVEANAELWNATNVNLQRAERALLVAAGIAVEALAPRAMLPIVEVTKPNVPDSMSVNVTVYNRGRLPVKFVSANVNIGAPVGAPATIAPDSAVRVTPIARANYPTTQWWRKTPRNDTWFTATVDSRDDAEHERDNAVMAHVRLEIAGVPITIETPVVNRVADPVKGELLNAVAAVPGIAIGLERGTEYIRANVPVTRKLNIRILSAYPAAESVQVSLILPKGLTADSATRVRVLTPQSPGAIVTFNLKGLLKPGREQLGAVALHDATPATTGYYTINYDHITTQRMYAPSGMWLEAVPVTLPLRARVAYIPGVGDAGIEALQQLDVNVERIEPSAVANTDFSRFTSVVVGPRAYASSDALVAANPRLLDYVKKGGTMVVQYGQAEMMRPGIMPYSIQLARTAERVTDETAEVTVLSPMAPMLNTPNKIGADDWKGWVQERATYMPSTFDKNYSPLLQMNDPNEAPNKAALLVAHYGKGTYAYVTLALFRQLPSGVPGAARILVNLISTTPATATPRMED